MSPAPGAAAVVWITGLPSAGKSTLARALHARLADAGRAAVLLDGDVVRPILGARGHDAAARDDFYARLAALAGHLAQQGVIVIVAATAHRRAYRVAARERAPRFVEVFVATPLAECERRDPKGLYAKARAGGAPDLPGVGVAFEPPADADVVADGGRDRAAIERVIALLS